MGRPSLSRTLSVWANGERVGRWTLPARGGSEFVYDGQWMSSPHGRPLSLSLPFTGEEALKGDRVRHYFDNLLPDSEPIRRRLATRFRTPSIEPFHLLQAVGRDCVGAVQLLGEDEEPGNIERIEGTPLSEDDVERLLVQTTQPRAPADPADEDELRISLAGAQEKTALLWHEGQWMKPHGATPTTHILKLPLGLVGHRQADFSTSVENEWLCMQLLEALGLPVPRTALLRFAAQKVLAVERFDRQYHSSGKWLLRLPQEDFCQALGVPPHLRYQSDGGPGLPDLARVLAASIHAERDLTTLLKTQVIFWLLAAPDGHAKNFSLRILAQGRHELTPLYDVMSIWPVEGSGAGQISWHKARLAMALLGNGRHYHLRSIQRRHFNSTARRCFLRSSAEDVIEGILARLPSAIEQVSGLIPAGFPERVAQGVFDGLGKAAERLGDMPAA